MFGLIQDDDLESRTEAELTASEPAHVSGQCPTNRVDPTAAEPSVALRHETLMQVISHEIETKRIAVVMIETVDRTYLVLRQQEWGTGIGWFTQKSIELDAGQLGPLRCTLQKCDGCKPTTNKRIVAEKINRSGLRIVS